MNSLNPYVLVAGVTCLGFFVTWLFGRKVESLEDAFDSLPAALVAMGALCMSPVFFYMAWHQIGAKARLSDMHLPVSPALGHAVGAQGGRAPRYVWRFEALDDPRSILDFYAAAAPAAGWTPERKKNGIQLISAKSTMLVWTEKHGDGDQIIFMLKPVVGSVPPGR